jgi:dTDP-glucose 4,6-dehydratase
MKPLPVYGKGENIRDWLFVTDHAKAIDTIFHNGINGHVYNIGGNNEWKNIDLVNLLCSIMDKKLDREMGTSASLITFVRDRPGHDLRYAIDSSKLMNETGWKPDETFETGLGKTVDWYLASKTWMENVTSGAYLQYYDAMYQNR